MGVVYQGCHGDSRADGRVEHSSRDVTHQHRSGQHLLGEALVSCRPHKSNNNAAASAYTYREPDSEAKVAVAVVGLGRGN